MDNLITGTAIITQEELDRYRAQEQELKTLHTQAGYDSLIVLKKDEEYNNLRQDSKEYHHQVDYMCDTLIKLTGLYNELLNEANDYVIRIRKRTLWQRIRNEDQYFKKSFQRQWPTSRKDWKNINDPWNRS